MSVSSPDRRFPLTHPLEHKLAEPDFWFRDVDAEGYPDELLESPFLGVIQAGDSCCPVHVPEDCSASQLRLAIAEASGSRLTRGFGICRLGASRSMQWLGLYLPI